MHRRLEVPNTRKIIQEPPVTVHIVPGKATVNALAFYNAYQALKARLFRGD